MVGHGGETDLVRTQREHQMRNPVGRRQIGIGHAHAKAVRALRAGRDEDGAGLADEPRPERAALERKPGPALQLARLMVEQVAEEALRERLGLVVARALPPRTARAAERMALGDE